MFPKGIFVKSFSDYHAKLTYGCDSDWGLPCSNKTWHQGVLNLEGVFHAEVLVLGVVHALDGIHVAKEHVIQPLNGHRGNFPLFGFLILVAFTAIFKKIKS